VHIPKLFLHLLPAAELEHCFTARLIGRQPGLDLLLG
jgi:hypothetical protein